MAKLIFSVIMSLDGFIADEAGNFDWAAPDDEVHAFVNDLERPVGTYLYGRRMYETMTFWETAHELVDAPPVVRDYAQIWRAANKIVYSRTLGSGTSAQTPRTTRTRVEGEFDPGGVRRLITESERDISVGGATLAAAAFRAGLVDACHLFIAPVVVGGGTRALPEGTRLDLRLRGTRTFSSGFVYAGYDVVRR